MAQINEGKVTMAMKIPWEPLEKTERSDVWLEIFFAATDRTHRSYLAWQPTMTANRTFTCPKPLANFILSDPLKHETAFRLSEVHPRQC